MWAHRLGRRVGWRTWLPTLDLLNDGFQRPALSHQGSTLLNPVGVIRVHFDIFFKGETKGGHLTACDPPQDPGLTHGQFEIHDHIDFPCATDIFHEEAERGGLAILANEGIGGHDDEKKRRAVIDHSFPRMRVPLFLLTIFMTGTLAGIYCRYDLIGREICASTLDEDGEAWQTGVVDPAMAGKADYPMDGSAFTTTTTRYVIGLFERAKAMGASGDKLEAWAACLEFMDHVTDKNMACLRDLMTFVADSEP